MVEFHSSSSPSINMTVIIIIWRRSAVEKILGILSAAYLLAQGDTLLEARVCTFIV